MTTTQSNHEASPACELVATRCVCCGRKLTDAVSVELGIGPDCRQTYGYGFIAETLVIDWVAFWSAVHPMNIKALNDLEAEQSIDVKKIANVLVHHAATSYKGSRGPFVVALRMLGFVKLANKIEKQAGKALRLANMGVVNAPAIPVLSVTREGDSYKVKAPYSPAFNQAVRANNCRAWFDGATKVWVVPVGARKGLWASIVTAFAGAKLVTATGETTVPVAALRLTG